MFPSKILYIPGSKVRLDKFGTDPLPTLDTLVQNFEDLQRFHSDPTLCGLIRCTGLKRSTTQDLVVDLGLKESV